MGGIAQIVKNQAAIKVRRKRIDKNWIEKMVDEHLSTPAGPSRKTPGSFFVSSLGNPCDRFLYYHYKGMIPENSIDGKLSRIFAHGNDMHRRTSEYFRKIGCLVAEEKSATWSTPSIRGRCDCIIRNPNTHIEYVLELKTINTRDFDKLMAPKPDHAIQLQVYLNLLNYENGALYYESKNDQKIKVFEMSRSKTEWDAILERCNRIVKMANAGTAPSIPENHDKYCPCLLV